MVIQTLEYQFGLVDEAVYEELFMIWKHKEEAVNR